MIIKRQLPLQDYLLNGGILNKLWGEEIIVIKNNSINRITCSSIIYAGATDRPLYDIESNETIIRIPINYIMINVEVVLHNKYL